MNYLDDSECLKLLALMQTSKINDELLDELAKFRTPSADKFLVSNISAPELASCIFDCRSDAVSDLIAAAFGEYLDSIEELTTVPDDMCARAWFLINESHFKQSAKMLMVYRRIARDWEKLRRKDIFWGGENAIDMENCPYGFIQRRAQLEQEQRDKDGTKTETFLGALCDSVICSVRDSMELYGESSEFLGDMRSIFEQYPSSFLPVQIYFDMIEDSRAAYDKWASSELINDRDLMFVLSGLYFEDGEFHQGSPMFRAGNDNHKISFGYVLEDFDTRWVDLLAEQPFRRLEQFGICGPYIAESIFGVFSERLLAFLEPDCPCFERVTRYFEKSAVYGGTRYDFMGLKLTGHFGTPQDITELYEKIAERICEGRQRFVFDSFEYTMDKADTENSIALDQQTMKAGREAALRIMEERGVPGLLAGEYEKLKKKWRQ